MNEQPKISKNIIASAVIFAVLALVSIVALLSSMRSVETGNIGVVTQYGKVTGRELNEGFAWVAPFGFNNVTEYSIKTQKEEQNAAAATKDLQDVTGTVVLNYRLERGKVSTIHQTVGKNYVDVLVTPAIQEVFKASTARFNALELINNRDKVKSDVVSGLKARLTDRGIVVEDVSLTNFAFSPEFTRAIEQRQVAQQNAERAKYNLQQAQLDAKSQDVQAKTLTSNYLRLKELENEKTAIDKWNGKMPTTVAGNGTIFNIPTSR